MKTTSIKNITRDEYIKAKALYLQLFNNDVYGSNNRTAIELFECLLDFCITYQNQYFDHENIVSNSLISTFQVKCAKRAAFPIKGIL